MIVRFGNAAPVYIKHHEDGSKERVVVEMGEGEAYRVTTSDIAVSPETHDLPEWLDKAFTSIVDGNGAWGQNSDLPPAWVESDWPDLERRLAAWFDCPAGEPTPEEG